MKLLRVGELGKEKPAILDKNKKIRDLSSHIKDFNSENLKFETSIVTPDSGSGTIGTNTYLNELYISPKRFWFTLEIYHKDVTNDAILPDKTYGYALLQKDTAPGSVTRGLTYNESLYTDTAGSSNKWKMTMSHVGGLIEDGIDYGYGAVNPTQWGYKSPEKKQRRKG